MIAALEGCSAEQAKSFVDGLRESLENAFEASLVFAAQQQQIVGAVVLRPMPTGHLELFGGVPVQANRFDISLALLRGARTAAPDAVLASFASDLYWDVSALDRAAGLQSSRAVPAFAGSRAAPRTGRVAHWIYDLELHRKSRSGGLGGWLALF